MYKIGKPFIRVISLTNLSLFDPHPNDPNPHLTLVHLFDLRPLFDPQFASPQLIVHHSIGYVMNKSKQSVVLNTIA